MDTVTSAEWLDAAQYILLKSMDIGAKIYPLLAALNILRIFASVI